MWIFCAGMKRAGSTLQYQLASHLVERAGRGSRLPWSPVGEFPELRSAHAGSPEWVVYKNHECAPDMAAELREGTARALCSFRDLRDVIASQTLMQGTTFDALWSTGFLEDCVAHYEAWTMLPGVAVSRYEEMVEDPAGDLRKLGAHIGLPLTGSEAEAISAEYSLDNQRDRIAKAEEGSARRVPTADRELVFDSHTLLHRNHINSGRAEAWREILSEEEARRVEERFGEWLSAHGYPAG